MLARRVSIRFGVVAGVAIFVLVAATSCENGAPREERISSTQPRSAAAGAEPAAPADSGTSGESAARAAPPSPGGDGAAAPEASNPDSGAKQAEAAVDEPTTTRPARPAPPKVPDYFKVLEKIDATGPVSVNAERGDRYRLTVETRNVQRLRFDRDELDFAAGRSLALLLDTQAFEVQSDTVSVEFERSRNGEWVAVTVKKRP